MFILTFSCPVSQIFAGRSGFAAVDMDVGALCIPASYLILDHRSTKCPDGSKHKIQLIGFLGAVCKDVLLGQETLKKVAEHLHRTLLWDRYYLLKSAKREPDVL